MSCHKLGGKELKIDNKTRRKRIAQGVRAMLWGERRERQSAERKRPAGRVKGRERDWGSAWYSKLTHSHGTQAPIRVRATLIKPDLQPLAAGWVNVCGSLDVCVFRIVDVCVCVCECKHINKLCFSHTVLTISQLAKSRLLSSWVLLQHVQEHFNRVLSRREAGWD